MVAHSRDLRKNKKKREETTQLNHVWAKPVPAEAADLVQNLLFFLPLFLSPCGGTLTRSEGEKKNETLKPCLGQTCAGRGSRPFSKSLVCFVLLFLFCFLLFFPLFLSPCGGTLMISEEKSKTKQNKNNNQAKPCLGQNFAGRGSRPLSKSLVLCFVFCVFFCC